MKNIALVLSGCGVYDGTEIHEAVLSMLAIKNFGGNYTIFAPDIDQHHVINHLTGEEMPESRNVLIESARIARGSIHALKEFDATKYDALYFPGGFGAAKNLSTYAFEGPDCSVNPLVSKAIMEMIELHKPIVALCVSPAIIAKVVGDHVKLTLGLGQDDALALSKMDAVPEFANHGEVVVDEKFKIITTPCYMLDASIEQIAEGANNAVKILMQMI